MKVANPNFLVPSAPPPVVKTEKPAAKKIGSNDKKLILRQNRREYYRKQNTNFGWRNNYNVNRNVYVNNYRGGGGGGGFIHPGSDEEHKHHKHCNHHDHYDCNCPDCRKADTDPNDQHHQPDDEHHKHDKGHDHNNESEKDKDHDKNKDKDNQEHKKDDPNDSNKDIKDHKHHKNEDSKHNDQKNDHKNDQKQNEENKESYYDHHYPFIGLDMLMMGGLFIMANPFDYDYINNHHFGDGLITGFYSDLPVENIHNINIDDIADFAQADVDLIGDSNIANYGAADLGISDIANDLQINEFVADAHDNPSVNLDAFADDYRAGSVGGASDHGGGNHHYDAGHHNHDYGATHHDYSGGHHDYGGGNDGGYGG